MVHVVLKKNNKGFDFCLSSYFFDNNNNPEKIDLRYAPLVVFKSNKSCFYLLFSGFSFNSKFIISYLVDDLVKDVDELTDEFVRFMVVDKIRKALEEVHLTIKSDEKSESMEGDLLFFDDKSCFHISQYFYTRQIDYYYDDNRRIECIAELKKNSDSREIFSFINSLFYDDGNHFDWPFISGNTYENNIALEFSDNRIKTVDKDDFLCR